MKAKQIPITSGPACGTLVTRVESNSGKLLGFIKVVAVEFGTMCHPSMFIVQRADSYKMKIVPTLLDAYLHLGVSSKELDTSYLGEYPYDEKTPSGYWRKHKEEIDL